MKCYEVVNEDKIGGMTQISANLAVRLPQHTLQKGRPSHQYGALS